MCIIGGCVDPMLQMTSQPQPKPWLTCAPKSPCIKGSVREVLAQSQHHRQGPDVQSWRPSVSSCNCPTVS